MKYLCTIVTLVLLVGCADPVKQERSEAIRFFSEFWETPEQIAMVRKVHDIPLDYAFKKLELIGYATAKDRDYGLYEWCFRFLKDHNDFIEIRMICYYDTDSGGLLDVKIERLHWKSMKIASRTYLFRGLDEEYPYNP